MAGEESFDIVSRVDLAEVKNAVNQAMMEIRQRFDFKGSKSDVRLDEGEKKIVLVSDDEVKMKSVVDLLETKLVRRKVSLKALQYGPVQQAGGGNVRREVTLQQGIPVEKAREIIKLIKQTKLKVQGTIQENQVRVSGKKRDDLQAVIAMLKEKDFGIDMQFVNYR
jgi:uncharacterized protein YajQ (UPF0234 family)